MSYYLLRFADQENFLDYIESLGPFEDDGESEFGISADEIDKAYDFWKARWKLLPLTKEILVIAWHDRLPKWQTRRIMRLFDALTLRLRWSFIGGLSQRGDVV